MKIPISLHVCEVNAGTGETLQIVCGAPNVRAGIKVACATIGAVLPGDFRSEVEASRRRLDGDALLDARTRHQRRSRRHLDSSGRRSRRRRHSRVREARRCAYRNQADAQPRRRASLVGVARDLHARDGRAPLPPETVKVEPTTDEVLPVAVEASNLCGRFSGRVIRGVNAKAKTPAWMKERLEGAGQRSISALVDISNYVMLELGRPTHFFDLSKIENGRLTVRWGREGEEVKLLNGQTKAIDGYYGVICDGDTPECLAGIMGGEKTSISDGNDGPLHRSGFLAAGSRSGPLPQAQLLDRCGLPVRARRRLLDDGGTPRIHHEARSRHLRHARNEDGPR